MLAELHRRFPRHLAMQSLGSFDAAGVRDLYRRHSLLPGNDLSQVHRYLDLGASLEICHGPVEELAADAVRELLGFGPQKPVILAEGGAVEPRHSGPCKLYATDKEGIILHADQPSSTAEARSAQRLRPQTESVYVVCAGPLREFSADDRLEHLRTG